MSILLPGYICLAQAPVITSVFPNIATVGSTVTITGANFDLLPANNIVYFGATRATVTAASATTLTVVVDTGASFGPISVLNLTNNLSAYQDGSFLPTFNNSYFIKDTINFRPSASGLPYTVVQVGLSQTYPYITVVGDLDGDGKPDLVVDNRHDPSSGAPLGTLTVFRNVSTPGWINNASFVAVGSASGTMTVGNQPTNIKLADMDGDGKLDIVVAVLGGNRVGVYLNTSTLGNISFAPLYEKIVYPTGLAPYVIGIADFNGDGKQDIAVTCRDSANVVVLKNMSTPGVCNFTLVGAFRCGLLPIGICTGDLDNDGLPDFAVADDSSETVSVFKNISAGGVIDFAPRVILPCAGKTSDIQCADMDGDGRLDLIVSVTSESLLSMFRNVSVSGVIDATSFEASADYPVFTSSPGTTTSPVGVAIGDLNGDGKPDIAFTNATINKLSIYRNKTITGASFTSGSLSRNTDFSAGQIPIGIGINDLDGDGYPEVIVANNTPGTIGIYRDYPLPAVDTIVGPRKICFSGAPVTYSNDTVGGYWTVSNTALATINSSTGVLTPIAAGAETVSYSMVAGGDTNTVKLVVTIENNPAAGTISGAVAQCAGTNITLTNAVTGGIWQTSDASIASVHAATATTAIANGVSGGVAIISYSVTNTCGTATAIKADTVKTIPYVSMIQGASSICGVAFTAMTDSSTGGTWSVQNPSVATISPTGLLVGVGAGTTTISYTRSNSCGTNSATLFFAVQLLATAGVVSGPVAVCEASTITLGSTDTGGVWSTDNTALATVSSTGVVTGVAAGSVIVSYTVTNSCNTQTDTQMITVNPLPVSGTVFGAGSVCQASTTTLHSTAGGGTWSNGGSGIATVTASGVVGGTAVGTAIISYTVTNGCGSATDTQRITVNPLPYAGLITGADTVCAGVTITLANAVTGGTWGVSTGGIATVTGGAVTGLLSGNAIVSYSISNGCGTATDTQLVHVRPQPNAGTITGTAFVCEGSNRTLSNTATGGTWSSSYAGVATVAGGVVHGIASGTVIISYTVTNSCGTAVDTEMITVLPLPHAGLVSGPTSVCIGGSIILNSTVAGGAWVSSNTAAATASGGTVGGAAAGSTVISYSISNSCGTDIDTQMVTVLPPTSAGTITGATSLCTGFDVTLTDAVSGGTWASSNAAVASVAGGVVHGATAGNAIISYTVTNSCGTATDTQMVVVNLSPGVAGITATASTLCAGSTISFSSTGIGGAWISGNSSVATVSSGVVGGVAGGRAIISYSITSACGTSVDTQMVAVNPLPDAGHISGPGAICTGVNITFTNTATTGAWSSSNAAVASVTAGGVVHGVTVGTAIISYTDVNGCGTATDTQMVTVNLSPDAGTITAATSTVCAGSAITLNNATVGGTWASGDNSIATVSGGVVSGLSAGHVIISYSVSNAACGTATDTQMVVVNPLPLAGTIAGATTVCTGVNITLSNSTTGGTWSSSDAAIASVAGGVVHGATAGAVIISYSVNNSCGTAADTQMVTVNLSPDAGHISGAASVCQGGTITLSSTAAGGTWASGNTAAATVSGGVVSGVAGGSAIISYSVVSASCGTATDTQLITVNPLPDAGTITGNTSVCTGVNITLSNTTTGGTWSSSDAAIASVAGGVVHGATTGTVIVSYSVGNGCGTAVDTQLVTVNLSPDAGHITGATAVCEGSNITLSNTASGGTWSSGSIAAATVSGGIVGGVAGGTAIISYSVATASCGTAVDTQFILVNPLPAAGVILGADTVCTGNNIVLSATVAGGMWSASNGTATVAGGTVAGVAPGADTISYTVTNGCGTAVVAKVVTIQASPVAGTITGAAAVCVGQTITLADTAAGGVWTASNTNATVSSSGAVSGISAGNVTITYTVANSCGSVFTVRAVTINPLAVAGSITGSPSVCAGAHITLSATVAGGVWSASNGNATVSGGVVAGVHNGTDTIIYTVTNGCGPVNTTKSIVINNATFADTISGLHVVCQGQSITLANTVTGGVWSSGDTAIAKVDTAGVVTGMAGGSVAITYAVSSICGTATVTKNVTVNPLPVAGVINGSVHLCIGSNITLTNTAGGGVWSAGNGFATVSGGIVTGIAAGTDTISYTVTNGCGSAAATHIVIVDPLPDTGIVTGLAVVCAGASVVLADTAIGGTWSSSNTAAATVSAGGIVTGVSAGTAIISYTVGVGCNVLSAHQAVTVNPVPVLTSSLTPPSVCDNTPFNYTPAGSIAGASINWTRDTTAGIANAPASGSGAISETLDNTTPLQVQVVYNIILSASGCADTQHVTAVIDPTPQLSSAVSLALCGGTFFNYVPVSATPGASYTWSRAAVSGVAPATASGVGAIHDSVINSTGGNVIVVYVYTITAGSCSATQNVTLILSPGAHMPHISIESPSTLCSATMYQNFGTADVPYAGEQFAWSAANGATVWATGAGAQNCIVNFTGTSGMAWVYLTSTLTSSGCALRDSFAAYINGNGNETPDIIYFDNEFVCRPSNEDTYQWGYDDAITLDSTMLSGETNQNYYNSAPDVAGKYYWVITTHHGCMQKTYYNAPVKVATVQQTTLHMQVLPNPSNGTFTLALASAVNEPARVIITDILGQQVMEWGTTTNTKEQVDLKAAAGVYLLSVVTRDGRYTERVVVGR